MLSRLEPSGHSLSSLDIENTRVFFEHGGEGEQKMLEPTESLNSNWRANVPPSELSTRELISAAAEAATELVRDEIELARIELKEDLKAQARSAIWLAAAGIGALMILAMLLVSAVLGLGTVIAGWGAALIIAGAVALVTSIAGLLGYLKIVRKPLETTRKTLKEDLEWAKKRLA